VTRLAGHLALVELVVVYARWERDVAGGQEEDPVALAALEGRSVSGSDQNTESTSEGATDIGGGVYGEEVVEKLYANGPGED
jgi:hypothetical protein